MQETLGQVLTLMQSNIIQHYAGNPNGNVAGTTYGLCWDTTNTLLYICTTSGNAATAVWTTAGSVSTPVTLAQGGTSKSLTASAGGIVWCDADSMEILAGVAAAGKMLQSGNLATPSWSTPTWPSASGTSGQLIISNGTNNVYSTPTYPNTGGTAGSVIISDGTNKINSTSLWPNTVGSAGKIIRSDGTVNAYTTSTFADTYAVSTLLYASSSNAVTGLATTNRAALSTNATGVPTWLALTDGQLVIGSTAGAPAAGTLTAGPGISIANTSNTITISGTGSGIGWTEVTGTTQAMVADSAYVANNAGLVTLTLPATAAFGTAIVVLGKGAGGWSIAQNAGQNIQVGNTSSTVGVGGSVSSTNRYDSISMICITADTTWSQYGAPQGNLTIV
ncbi:MAG: hypothetical protein PHV62_03185 [Sulfuricurvum sp.]|nr:hypothetical protein [Sulfuricurvum sp.]